MVSLIFVLMKTGSNIWFLLYQKLTEGSVIPKTIRMCWLLGMKECLRVVMQELFCDLETFKATILWA